jgi:hypothetical protein
MSPSSLRARLVEKRRQLIEIINRNDEIEIVFLTVLANTQGAIMAIDAADAETPAIDPDQSPSAALATESNDAVRQGKVR